MVIQPRWNKFFFSHFQYFPLTCLKPSSLNLIALLTKPPLFALPLATFVLPLFHVSRLKPLVPSFLHSFFFFFSLSLLNHVSRYYFKAISS
ncbi:hypothetical protein ES319_D13G142400v1, partial [Gossypium barbadense]